MARRVGGTQGIHKGKGVDMRVDLEKALKVGATMEALHATLNTDQNLGTASKAAFAILESHFNTQTGAMAATQPRLYHHIYEWEHIGVPQAALYKLNLGGRGGNRTVTWDWRASKKTVPTETDVEGNQRFKRTDKFDPEKLNRVHVFVWKAPMMEYGVSVNIRPRNKQYLVFPMGGMDAQGGTGGPRDAVFTPHAQGATPGKDVQGNFTAWFISWWGGTAEAILSREFDSVRDTAFKKIFETRLKDAKKTKMARKTMSFTPNAAAARQGKTVAALIAGDLNTLYYKMSAGRLRFKEDAAE